jgi:hypothetical protein
MKDSTTLLNSQNLEKLYGQAQDEIKQEKPSPLSPEKARLIQKGLERLVSYGLLSDPSAIRDWANGLADISEERLTAGFVKAKDYTGYLALGDLRNMCKKPMQNGSYRPYQALPHKSMDKDELRARIAKMREETGI